MTVTVVIGLTVTAVIGLTVTATIGLTVTAVIGLIVTATISLHKNNEAYKWIDGGAGNVQLARVTEVAATCLASFFQLPGKGMSLLEGFSLMTCFGFEMKSSLSMDNSF